MRASFTRNSDYNNSVHILIFDKYRTSITPTYQVKEFSMNKMLIAAAASSVLLLAGCASGPDEATTAKINEISTQVSELNSQVAALASKVDQAAEAAKAAQEEAARANERIDNIAQSYTK
ncbi:outer membrane lipoprotein [Vibrio cholerae TM 11079-80]|nr:outer membrane lipoprotein [Vibrio cholerae TM 11079-80]